MIRKRGRPALIKLATNCTQKINLMSQLISSVLSRWKLLSLLGV